MSHIFSPFYLFLAWIVVSIGLSLTSFAETVISIANLVFIVLIVLFIHELGHVMGAKLAGYRFLFMTVGPITFEKSPNLKIVPNHHWLTFGGVASCIPKHKEDISTMVRHQKWFTAGGPVFTGIAFLMSLAIWLLTKHDTAMMLMIINMAILFVTAIPSTGTFKSDGGVFLLLHKGGEEAEAFLAEMLLIKEMMSPKTPLEWDEELIREAQKSEASVDKSMTAYLLFCYLLMKHDYETATQAIAPFKTLPISKKTRINLQFIMHIRQIDALNSHEPDLEFIQALHSQLSRIEPISYKRSEAIIAYLKGDLIRANHLLDDVIRNCEKEIQQYGFCEAERKLTLYVKQRLDILKKLCCGTEVMI